MLLLHHFGKDEKAGMRGGTVLPANIDNVFAMARQRDERFESTPTTKTRR